MQVLRGARAAWPIFLKVLAAVALVAERTAARQLETSRTAELVKSTTGVPLKVPEVGPEVHLEVGETPLVVAQRALELDLTERSPEVTAQHPAEARPAVAPEVVTAGELQDAVRKHVQHPRTETGPPGPPKMKVGSTALVAGSHLYRGHPKMRGPQPVIACVR